MVKEREIEMARLFRGALALILIVGLMFLSQGAFAEDQASSNRAHKAGQSAFDLEEIQVADKTVTEPVTSPYAVTKSSQLQMEVWTKEEIQALHPETVLDLLEQIPGMEVTFQGRQHLDFSNARGTGNYRIILDGVYISSIDRLVATLPVDDIASMTVVRDATALTIGPLTNFGSSTGGSNQGFVVIKTKRASKLEGGIVSSYGTFDTFKAYAYQGAKIGDFDYRLSGSLQGSDGKDDWYNGYDNNSFDFRGGYTGSFINGDVLYYHSRGMREFERGLVLVPATAKNGTLDWSKVGALDNSKWKIDPMEANLFAVNLSKPWSDTQTTMLNYAYDNLKVRTIQDSFAPGASVTRTDQNSVEWTTAIKHVSQFYGHILKLGGQYMDYVCPNGLAPNTGKRVDESMASLFAQDEYRMLNDRLTFDGGIRGDKKHFDNSPISGKPMDESAEETWSYSVGASYKLNALFTMTGRYAYQENDSAGYQISTNGSSLPTEKRSRFEAGMLADIHPFFNPWVTGYYYDTKDQMVSATGIDPTTKKSVTSYIDPKTGEEIDFVAAADVATKGVEAGFKGQIYRYFNYRFQYTYVTTNDDTTNKSIAHNLFSGFLGCLYEKAFGNVSFRYVSAHNRSSSPAGVFYYELGDYTRVDANLGYNFNLFDRNTRITLYGRNLTDEHYATRYVAGTYRDPGLQVGAELALSFF